MHTPRLFSFFVPEVPRRVVQGRHVSPELAQSPVIPSVNLEAKESPSPSKPSRHHNLTLISSSFLFTSTLLFLRPSFYPFLLLLYPHSVRPLLLFFSLTPSTLSFFSYFHHVPPTPSFLLPFLLLYHHSIRLLLLPPFPSSLLSLTFLLPPPPSILLSSSPLHPYPQVRQLWDSNPRLLSSVSCASATHSVRSSFISLSGVAAGIILAYSVTQLNQCYPDHSTSIQSPPKVWFFPVPTQYHRNSIRVIPPEIPVKGQWSRYLFFSSSSF